MLSKGPGTRGYAKASGPRPRSHPGRRSEAGYRLTLFANVLGRAEGARVRFAHSQCRRLPTRGAVREMLCSNTIMRRTSLLPLVVARPSHVRERVLKAVLVLPVALLAWSALADGFDLRFHFNLAKNDSIAQRHGMGGVSDSVSFRGASSAEGIAVASRSGVSAFGGLWGAGETMANQLIGVLSGLELDLGALRLEPLRELGSHRGGQGLADTARHRSGSGVWGLSLGIRPGIALHSARETSLVSSLWTFARWDQASEDVRVNFSRGGDSLYGFAGSRFAIALRVGVSL